MAEAPEDLTDLYTDELKDLWSANDQMTRVVKKLTPKASDSQLKDMLKQSVEGITKHTAVLKELLAAHDERRSPRSIARAWKAWLPKRPSTASRKRLRRARCSMR